MNKKQNREYNLMKCFNSLFFSSVFTLTLALISESRGTQQEKEWGTEDVHKSIKRVREVFHRRYEEENVTLLYQENNVIGCMRFEDNNIFITFRGSQGYQELWSSRNKRLHSLQSVGLNLEGRGHEGYCWEFQNLVPLRQNILYQLQTYGCEQQHLNLTLEGSSKGAVWAALMAADLKGSSELQQVNVCVLTYALANIFDPPGVESYNGLVGKKNHLNFWAQEDEIARYADVSDQFIGTLIPFFAQELDGYQQRVRDQAFTNMMAAPRRILSFELGGD